MTEPLFPGRSLGRRPAKHAPSLKLADVMTGTVPPHPPSADHFSEIGAWVLGSNNAYGTCGPVSVANALLLTTRYLTGTAEFTATDDVFDLYRRSGNPEFDPATGVGDNGVVMQTMLEALHAGGIAGHRPVCFAEIDVTDHALIRAAEAIFGCVLLGVDLHTAQAGQTDTGLWDFTPGSSPWGGHAVMSGRYTDVAGVSNDRTGVITWAQVVDTTERFLDVQLMEAWVVIWPGHLRDDAFLEGVDLSALARAYEDLTGRPLPGPTPEPPPAPAPAGPPPGCLARLATLGLWGRRARGGHRRT